MNEVYNGRFAPDFSVSVLKEIVALVQDYVSEISFSNKNTQYWWIVSRANYQVGNESHNKFTENIRYERFLFV